MISIGNRFLRLAFDEESNGGIAGVRTREPEHEFLAPGDTQRKLWEIEVKDTDEELSVLSNDTMCTFSHERSDALDGSTLSMCWEDEAARIKVEVQVLLDSDSVISLWRMRIQNADPLQGIWKVRFPLIESIGPICEGGQDDTVSVPYQAGMLIRDPVHTLLAKPDRVAAWAGRTGYKYENEYPCQFAMQFFSFFREGGPGLYLATHDPDTYIKTFGLHSGEGRDSFDYIVTHYPEDMGRPRADYEVPYPCVVGVFRGDWTDAAGIYRRWAVGQRRTRAGTLAHGREISLKAKQIGLWKINHASLERGNQEGFDASCIALQRYMDVPVGVHWYQWNGRWHDSDSPEHFPEDAAIERRTKQWIKHMQSSGLSVIPYTNGRLWCPSTKTWKSENAAKYAVKDENQRIWCDGEDPNPPDKQGRTMCPHTDFWKEKMRRMVKRCVDEYGFDGVYLDQIGAHCAVPCFDAGHGHPVGGGRWWSEGYRDMLAKVRADNPEAILTTESCCEAYIDCFDLLLTLEVSKDGGHAFQKVCGANWEPVPLFHAVYHDFAAMYGSAMAVDPGLADYFFLQCARLLNWGVRPTVDVCYEEHLADKRNARMLACLKKVVNVFSRYPEYFLCGQWLPPAKLDVPTMTVHCKSGFTREVPAVLTSCWRAGDGSVACVLFNVSDREVGVDVDLRGPEYRLPRGRVREPATPSSGSVEAEHGSCASARHVSVPGRDFRLLRVSDAGE